MKTNINIISKGQHLSGTLILPEVLKDKNPTILFIHGLTGQKDSSYQYANGLAKLGYISLLFDMRGHGESGNDVNTISLKVFSEDAVSVYDYLRKIEDVDQYNISVVGSSTGAYLAALLTSKKGIKNLVMRAPADYPNEVFDKPIVKHGGENPDTMKRREQEKTYLGSLALEAVHNFHGRILIIESENDDMVPHTTVQNYINAVSDKSKLNYIVLKGAPHSIKEGKFRNEVEKILLDWFDTR